MSTLIASVFAVLLIFGGLFGLAKMGEAHHCDVAPTQEICR